MNQGSFMNLEKRDEILKTINAALRVDHKMPTIDRVTHRTILEATGMDNQMIEGALNALEENPLGLMWYHSREWLRNARKDAQKGLNI